MGLLSAMENRLTMLNDPTPGQADMVIGMGADVSVDGQRPSPQSEAIARKAFELAIIIGAPRLLFSGGYRRGGPCEARAMATFVRQTFEVTNRPLEIIAETKSRTTRQNVVYCSPILYQYRCRSVVVVAQQWHARRVRAVWRKLTAGTGIKVMVIKAESPYGGGTQARLANWPTFLAWDSFAFVVSKLKGYC